LPRPQDLSTRRNCLAMLTAHAPERAIRYLLDNAEALGTWGDLLQLAALDLIRKASGGRRGVGRAGAGSSWRAGFGGTGTAQEASSAV
jgi:hypothetical protein